MTPEDLPTRVSRSVRNEFTRFAFVAALPPAALDRDWLPLVVATDAAPEYGFGDSICEIPNSDVAFLGSKTERRADFVRLERLGDSEDEAERPRIGKPHH